ncbi:DUF975 family protein [Candidatus Parcubacteria bacterium]|nr:DUF975 family protein [Candidatus Parcubacteria bacterium]
MNDPFSIKEAIKFGWEKTRAHSGLIFKVVLTIFGLQIAQSVVQHTLGASIEGVFAYLILVIVNVVVGVGALVISLNIQRGHHAEYSQIIPPLEMVVRYFFATILACIMIVVGFILLIIPGIYLALRFSMVRFAAIDGKGIFDALKESGKLTHGVKWKLLGFFIVVVALNILGFLALFVGVLVTVPVTMIASAYVYQKLLHRHHA